VATNGSKAIYHKQMCQSQISFGYPVAAISRVSSTGKPSVTRESSGILPGQATSDKVWAAALARRTQRSHFHPAQAKATQSAHDNIDAIVRNSSMQVSPRGGPCPGTSPMRSKSPTGHDRQRFMAQMCGDSPIGVPTGYGADPHCGMLPRRGRSASPPSSIRVFPTDANRASSPRSPGRGGSPSPSVQRLHSSPSPSRSDPLLCNAARKLEEWKSFKQLHKGDLQKVLAGTRDLGGGAAGGGWQSGDEAARGNAMAEVVTQGLGNGTALNGAVRKLTRKDEAIFVSANCSSNVAPERRRDYNCPVRSSSTSGLASKKAQIRNCVHPVSTRPVDPLLNKSGDVSRRSLGSQRDRAALPPRVLGERVRQR